VRSKSGGTHDELTKAILPGVLVVLGALESGTGALAAERVWVFDQTNGNIKPCFRFSRAGGWVDFGNIAADGQFA
jgi:hypothetical protein